MNRKKYRKWLLIVFVVYITVFLYYLSYRFHTSIPDGWQTGENPQESVDCNMPLTVQADAVVSGEEKIVPLGMPVGIYIKTKGVLVLGVGEVTDVNGSRVKPAENILQSGDYILEADGKAIHSIEEMTEILEDWKGGDLMMKVLRGKEETILRLTPVRVEDSEYKIGVWIRQDAQGIGTLSYVDSKNNFGALGHGITDVDTGLRIDISGGRLYQTQIFSIVKGENGNPGEMIGTIDYRNGQILGNITSNNENGIFGSLAENVRLYDESQAIPVGKKEEIEKGPASIRCCVDGEIKEYAVEIESIDKGEMNRNRDMVIEIKDSELLKRTNGIVQGMSGSPIIQNGKFIGAVTHVFINDSTKGYGIFAEKMLEANEK